MEFSRRTRTRALSMSRVPGHREFVDKLPHPTKGWQRAVAEKFAGYSKDSTGCHAWISVLLPRHDGGRGEMGSAAGLRQ